jgi:hypothetical protein
MLLDTYRLQNPKEKELAALIHENRLMKTRISDVDILKQLWVSSALKDQLRRLNKDFQEKEPELFILDNSLNSEMLNQHLFHDDEFDDIVRDEENLDQSAFSDKISSRHRPNLQSLLSSEYVEQSKDTESNEAEEAESSPKRQRTQTQTQIQELSTNVRRSNRQRVFNK